MEKLFNDFECGMKKGAIISDCGTYRYSLWRIWDESKPIVGYILLNPSKADAEHNDPTIERLIERAAQLGYGGIIVVNLFAYRATDPKELYRAQDPIGPSNDYYISQELRKCSLVICGWGKNGKLLERDAQVLAFLKRERIIPQALSVNFDGTPEHPLYISYAVKPVTYMTDWVKELQ